MEQMKKRVLCLLLTFAMLLGTNTQNLWAATDNKLVTVSKTKQAVDTFKNVPAYYRPGGSDGSDSTYSCAALVKRYYQTIYGKTPYNLLYNQTPIISSGYFYKVSTPQVGDIVGYPRKNGASNHWAIVREVKSGYVILLEQNWKWTSSGKTYTYSRHKVGINSAPNANYNKGIYFRYSKAATVTSVNKTTVTGARSLTLNKSSVSIKSYYTTAKLVATIKNKRSGDKVQYTTSNSKVATVSSNGTISGKKKGTAYITAKIKGTSISKKCKVKVKKGPRVLKLNATSLTFVKVKSFNLKGTVYNKKSGDTVQYQISNSNVATVGAKGLVTKKKKGTATITATVKGTSVKKTCKVIVK